MGGTRRRLCPPEYGINICTCCLHYCHLEHGNSGCKPAHLETALQGTCLEIRIMFQMSSGGEWAGFPTNRLPDLAH